MGEGIALSLLSVSLSGACLMGAAEGMARLLRGRISPAARRLLWILVLARLLCPWSPPGGLLDRAAAVRPSLPPAGEHIQTSSQPSHTSHTQETEKIPTQTSGDSGLPSEGLLLLWAAGAEAVLIRYGAGYVRLSRTLRVGRRPAGDEARAVYASLIQTGRHAPGLVLCPSIPCPMLAGLLRPVIVLPDRPLSREELEGVLSHELTHWRQRDLWLKWLAALAAAVHWFNPAVWLLAERLDRDCELSCDRKVVRHWDVPRRARYGELILRLAAGGACPPASMFSRKQRLKERLIAMMEPKQYGKRAAVLGAAACLTLVLASTALGAYTGPAAVEQDLSGLPAAEPERPAARELAWPLEVGDTVELSALFQGSAHPANGEVSGHTGIDIPWDEGAPVLAAADGTVLESAFDLEYGNYVVLRHGELTTRYCHLRASCVEPGEQVSAGAAIGEVGRTGMSTGPHLHFETAEDGRAVDPLTLLDGGVEARVDGLNVN